MEIMSRLTERSKFASVHLNALKRPVLCTRNYGDTAFDLYTFTNCVLYLSHFVTYLFKRRTLNPDLLDYLALAVRLNRIFINQVGVLSKPFQY